MSRALGLSLAPVLVLGAVAGAAPGAVAASAGGSGSAGVGGSAGVSGVAGPWGPPAALTGGSDGVGVAELVTASDGTVVAVWHQRITGTYDLQIRAAVRPANSSVWGASTLVDTMDLRGGWQDVRLLPAPDGSVALTWLRTGDVRTVRTSVLAPGASAWSPPVDIVSGAGVAEPVMAIGAGGRAVLVWSRFVGRATEIFVHERGSASGGWSAPVRLDDTPAEILEGGSQILFGADGSTTVLWSEGGPQANRIVAVEKAAGAGTWSAPRALSAPATVPHGARAASGPDGTAVLTWTTTPDISGGESTLRVAVRPAGSSQWGPVETVGPADSAVRTEPLVAANGEITLVWGDSGESGFGVRTTTRSPAGVWSPVRTLSTRPVPDTSEQLDAAIGPDGTVHAGWVQESEPGGPPGRAFRYAARVDGVWTAPTVLSRKPSAVAIGQVTGGPQGRTTAVWHESTGDFTGQLWSAGTGLPGRKPPVRPAAHRDHVGDDGYVDLFSRTAKGELTVHRGTASGTFSAKVKGGVWPTTSTLLPFDDLNGDGANEVLVRDASGTLRAYRPARGAVVTPKSPSVRIGSGWGAFDSFATGDLTNDGRMDLLAREKKTGALRLYEADGKGAFAPARRVSTGWKGLTLVGAGELNGDKRDDLLARDAAGVLWRYEGTGNGTFRAKVRIGAGWGGFTSIVGVGDLTGDGRDDLVARDAAGVLWRYDGTGKGGFRAKVRIGTGWKGYTGLF
ncbi:FG-GAP repeat domain-containing protein [Streptomyces yaizuensis]|uniref:FG-GAP-like repeat-containing protein n=1 Tax=Streptomyces yaizuensis TaxID=2989713 RepID=A0ABQ5P087_9ACTN|nr:VCBS repeat-containing protein [Streptomyces sp. YSPA8]GLF95885.1 FG-GAP-like repeat-containing protein [Streptomyces sp. YSPA8]